ncbi:hypothetical protein AMS68_003554 [Peltaster fructicola]|uniref:Ran GTPase-activating protein 1 n=1 Tax=Peltaster fructicola TaxID=286661 RepID=A0A6H0XTE0_9PEZI|nr:hypothetical protein AMS68_003554 [Peltaster fructicola]
MAEQVFSLRGRALKLDTAEDVKKHISALESNPDVEEVHFEGNTFGVSACEYLADVLATKSKLRLANLADLFTGRLLSEIPQALHALLTALLKCEKLETINLNDNAFGLNTVEPLRPFLSQHAPLRHLYLNNNGLGPTAGTYVAEALEKLAAQKAAARKEGKNVPDLETVVCGRNRLEVGSMAAWVKAYTANNKVRTIKMVQNGIRPEGVKVLLAEGLVHCKELEVLDLQDNTFTSLAGKTLADVVTAWPALIELGVSDTLLSARSGLALAASLSKGENKKLEVLRLQFDEIDAKGVKAFADAADTTALPRLRRIELNGNKFLEEDPNIERLRELLEKRKEESASEYAHVDEDDEEAWGVDELDELEEDEDDEDEAEEEEEELEKKEESIVKQAEQAESQPVAQQKDTDVDELADALSKTQIK